MSRTPIENHADLRIGMVEFISPTEIKVRLDLEAPDGIAANAGSPRAFPRINSYVLIPSEGGCIVCQIEWIAIDRLSYQKKGSGDYGLIDLPLPMRNMLVVPLGVLCLNYNNTHKFHRGVTAFPSIGSPVLMPTDQQLKAIIESGSNRRVLIGSSPLTANAEVKIDPDRLFGRHLAVLGNTGSGKSCTVAGLIHWTLEATEKEKSANARFVVLDPNGEYAKSFGDKAKVFKVGDKNYPLEVPLWLWNAAEWRAFTQAAPGVQFPLLRRTLRAMRNEETKYEPDPNARLEKFTRLVLSSVKSSLNNGDTHKGLFYYSSFIDRLCTWKKTYEEADTTKTDEYHSLVEALNTLVSDHREIKPNGFITNSPFSESEVTKLIRVLSEFLKSLGGEEKEILPKDENIPIHFLGKEFITYIEALAQDSGNEQHMDFLITRIQTLLTDIKMNSVIGEETEKELDNWLAKYLGNGAEAQVSVIDLSLVPSEIIHIVTSVISRIMFEALQRYRTLNSKSLPTVLVLEEAHTFITRYNESNDILNSSTVCTKIFEKIAREGRKFGLGLVLSSQRPSELSPTVISQCNSFILHRISNDRDQDLVGRLLPDSFRGLLKELPSLPSQKAVILGWASELPLIFNVRTLEKAKRPQSDDPDFWDVWTGKDNEGNDVERSVDWKVVADDWQEKIST